MEFSELEAENCFNKLFSVLVKVFLYEVMLFPYPVAMEPCGHIRIGVEIVLDTLFTISFGGIKFKTRSII